jgi:YD repeat-containing protein
VQTHLTQDINNDLVRSVFFDAAGRTQYTTNLYIDNTNQVFVKDNFEKINTDKLKNLYNDQRAFTEIEYYKDPLNRISCIREPGNEFVNHWVYYWYFSVNRINSAEVVTVNGTKGSVAFKNGFIISCIPVGNSGFKEKEVLDEISAKMLEANPYVTKELVLFVTMDSDDHITQKLTNSFGDVIATRSDPSKISTTDAIISNYRYDIFGNISLAEAPKKGAEGNSSAEKIIDDTHYTYNSLGQLVETKTPDGPLYKYDYNDIGEMAFARAYDINNNCIRELSYTYDNLQRLTIVYQIVKDKNGNSIKVLRIQNVYDDVDLLNEIKMPSDYLNKIKTLLKNIRGRQIASLCFSDGNRAVGDFYSYDDEGRIDQKVKMIPGVPLQIIKCTYDLQNKLILENIDCGNKSINKKYEYDKLGRIKSIEHVDNKKDLVDYSYDNLGRMNKKTFGIKTGMSMNYDYSVRNWLTSISNSDLTGFNEIISYSGIYNGNIKSTEYKYNINGTPNVFKQTYSYDQSNRLIDVTSVNADYSANYSYNEVGQFH